MNYTNPWIYNGYLFKIEDYPEAIGFVYLITCTKNNKKYIGKKNFYSKKIVQKNLKKKKVRIDSDWRDYYGSSDELKEEVVKLGWKSFRREIIHLCKSKGEMNYLELKEQMVRDVLLREDYYNSFAGGKIHRRHVATLKIPLDT